MGGWGVAIGEAMGVAGIANSGLELKVITCPSVICWRVVTPEPEPEPELPEPEPLCAGSLSPTLRCKPSAAEPMPAARGPDTRAGGVLGRSTPAPSTVTLNGGRLLLRLLLPLFEPLPPSLSESPAPSLFLLLLCSTPASPPPSLMSLPSAILLLAAADAPAAEAEAAAAGRNCLG